MCSSACPTPGAHQTWGECVRAKGLQIGDLTGTGDARTTDKRLDAYANARRQGIQPQGTKLSDSLGAMRAAGA